MHLMKCKFTTVMPKIKFVHKGIDVKMDSARTDRSTMGQDKIR